QREAFAWFPADTNVVTGMELRPPQATFRSTEDLVSQLFARMLSVRDREELYRTAEAIGNVRLDCVTVGAAVDENGDSVRIAVRLSGAGDRKRIADFLVATAPGVAVKQEKGPKGEPITLLEGTKKGMPALALIGDSDVVLVVQADKGNTEALRQVLEVRAGKQKGVPDGKLARLTLQAPRNARTVVAYELSEKTLKKAFRHIEPLPAAPRDLLVYVTKGDPSDATKAGKLAIHFRGRMKDAEEAKVFAEAAGKLKQEGLKALDNVPPQEKVPQAVIKAMKDTLSALKVEASRGSVNGELTIANESALVEVLRWTMERRIEPPAPPERLPEKPPARPR
ncbi:MAG TPA: hypothetical protein VKD72_38290, partial [Gemmataceae bacterium]|nr:hypothetical protein [Gemmataceae bacterium]